MHSKLFRNIITVFVIFLSNSGGGGVVKMNNNIYLCAVQKRLFNITYCYAGKCAIAQVVNIKMKPAST